MLSTEGNGFDVILEGHAGDVRGAMELADGAILSWSDDKTLRLWSGADGNNQAVFEGHTGEIVSALELSKGRILSWTSENDAMRIWDRSGSVLIAVRTKFGVAAAKAAPDGRVLTWSREGPIWDADESRPSDRSPGRCSVGLSRRACPLLCWP